MDSLFFRQIHVLHVSVRPNGTYKQFLQKTLTTYLKNQCAPAQHIARRPVDIGNSLQIRKQNTSFGKLFIVLIHYYLGPYNNINQTFGVCTNTKLFRVGLLGLCASMTNNGSIQICIDSLGHGDFFFNSDLKFTSTITGEKKIGCVFLEVTVFQN